LSQLGCPQAILHERPEDRAWRTALPPRTVTVARRQATGLIPVGGMTVAGQRRAFTGLRCRCTAAA